MGFDCFIIFHSSLVVARSFAIHMTAESPVDGATLSVLSVRVRSVRSTSSETTLLELITSGCYTIRNPHDVSTSLVSLHSPPPLETAFPFHSKVGWARGWRKKDIRTTFSSSSAENALFASVIMNVRHFGFGGASHTLIPQFTASPLKKVHFPTRAFSTHQTFFFLPASCWRGLMERQEKANWHFCLLIGENRRFLSSPLRNETFFLPSALNHSSFSSRASPLDPKRLKGRVCLPLAQKRSRRVHKVNWWTSRSVYSRSLPLPPC